jgi:hypothetical protein
MPVLMPHEYCRYSRIRCSKMPCLPTPSWCPEDGVWRKMGGTHRTLTPYKPQRRHSLASSPGSLAKTGLEGSPALDSLIRSTDADNVMCLILKGRFFFLCISCSTANLLSSASMYTRSFLTPGGGYCFWPLRQCARDGVFVTILVASRAVPSYIQYSQITGYFGSSSCGCRANLSPDATSALNTVSLVETGVTRASASLSRICRNEL